MTQGWRTLAIQGATKISTREGRLILSDLHEKTEQTIPLDEISRVVMMTGNGIMTSAALRELSERHVSVILCNRQYNPMAELSPYAIHEEAAGALMDQVAWTQERKAAIWAEIVRCKIANQIHALELSHAEVPHRLRQYLEEVQPGDPNNREGQAARVYFQAMFGPAFRRHAPDGVNAALNYGYALLCSGISRGLALHGYHTALGIQHNNRGNRFNLSCDLMEPFRPFVDRYVYTKKMIILNAEHKKDLILLLQESCLYAGKSTSIDDALELFALDTVKALTDGRKPFRRVEFE